MLINWTISGELKKFQTWMWNSSWCGQIIRSVRKLCKFGQTFTKFQKHRKSPVQHVQGISKFWKIVRSLRNFCTSTHGIQKGMKLLEKFTLLPKKCPKLLRKHPALSEDLPESSLNSRRSTGKLFALVEMLPKTGASCLNPRGCPLNFRRQTLVLASRSFGRVARTSGKVAWTSLKVPEPPRKLN